MELSTNEEIKCPNCDGMNLFLHDFGSGLRLCCDDCRLSIKAKPNQRLIEKMGISTGFPRNHSER